VTAEPARRPDEDRIGADVFVARQPIFSRRAGVYGYELLFRDGVEQAFGGGDGNAATSSVIETGLLNIGLDQLTGGRPAFINFTRDLLLADEVLQLPRREIVIEILETIEPEPAVLEACEELKRRGCWEPLLHLADIVKFEYPVVRATDSSTFEERVRPLRLRGVKLLAEKIETRAEYDEAVGRNFQLFQGFFWGRPETVSGKKIEASPAAWLELMKQVQGAGMNVGRVKDVIKSDPALSLSLLRYINSGLFRWMSRVDSIHRAIVLLGPDEIRRWVAFMAVTTSVGADRPKELVVAAVTRGRFCELHAAAVGMASRALDLFFMGLFSLADVMLGLPLEEALEHVPLSKPALAALLAGSGDFAPVLQLAIAYEQGDWSAVSDRLQRLHLDEHDAPARYREALDWARHVLDAGG
jgi:EAL and modified HD-GYP domain-containing signal transduction protein